MLNKPDVENLNSKIEALAPSVKEEEKKQLLLELQDTMSSEGFWDNPESATEISRKVARLDEYLVAWGRIKDDIAFLSGLDEGDLQDSIEIYNELNKNLEKFKKLVLLSGEYDSSNAILGFHAGAGGDDATDFAEMLLRMITRYCESNRMKVNILEINRNPAAGIKSALIEVVGDYAYGKLKGEHGVHRLVRLSPFNQAHTRETSFALIEVLPEVEESKITKIDEKDIKLEVNTASGHGGQSVNTTYSAVRITHIPTGIKVSIQNERSQAQNREVAMKILLSKLQKLEEEKNQAARKELRGEFKSAEWGNQIRNYVLHPYKLVKDNRTGYESAQVEDVLEGDLDPLIDKYLELIN